MKLGGIDIGTTGCKITIYEENGRLVKEVYEEYERDNINEIDGLYIWQCVKSIILKASKECYDLKAIGITSFGETFVLLSEDDKPLMNAILYTDKRGEDQCNRLISEFGKEFITKITGVSPHLMYSLPKLMWIKENNPDILKKAKRICLMGDFIGFLLTGVSKIPYSLATRTLGFDINNLKFYKPFFDFLEIEMEMLPEPVPDGEIVGEIKDHIADSLNIPRGIKVITAGQDQFAAAVGTGILEIGEAVDGIGTVECITTMFKNIPSDNSFYNAGYVVVPYIKKGTYLTYAYTFTGGALLKWYRDKIAYEEAKIIKCTGKNPYEIFNEKVKDGPSGLLIIPHFSGAATPHMNAEIKGAILGLTTETSSIDIYHGLMEGVTYEMLLNIDHLKKSGIEIKSIRATGGGATSGVWLQMKADIFNIPVTTIGAVQSGTLGSIMLAGVSTGVYKDINEALNIFISLGNTYFPREDKHREYKKQYEKYKKLYDTIDILKA